MKGINLKKIGAIVAGATILASSVAFAGLMYQNTELVNMDGQPVAKVVIGANAMASDGVAAALISNKLANEAYKSTTLTAEYVGEATCSGGAEGSGTCDVVEGSETVTLAVTIPGAGIEGVHEFTTAIADYIDRELENRHTNASDDDEAFTVFDDFEDTDSNPFQNLYGAVMTNSDDLDGNEAKTMYKIGKDNFGPFAAATVSDTKVGTEYVEWENFWLFGNDHWDEADQEVYGEVVFGAYTALFDATGDYGIPVCPGDEDEDWTTCDDLEKLPAHKVFVSFLGEDWVISEIEGITGGTPQAVSDKEVYQIDNAKVTLAKEAVSGIINVGEFLEAPSGYKVRLDDISRETGASNSHPAIITVLDANDNEICQDQVYPGSTKDDLCDVSTGVKLHVYQTAPGLNFIAKWAEMAIYKDEIELESNVEFLDDDDTEWTVQIGWSNKGNESSGGTPEYLRNIILANPDPDDMDEMEAGDVFPVVDLADYEKYDLIYNGIDDEGTSYDGLQFKVVTSKNYSIVNSTSATECDLYFQNAVEVSTSEEFRLNKAWEGFGSASSKRGQTMYYIPRYNISAGGTSCIFGWNYTGTSNPSPVLLFKDHDNDIFAYDFHDSGVEYVGAEYRNAGGQGYVTFYNVSRTVSSVEDQIWLVENAGKWDSTDIVDAMGFQIETDFDLKEPFVTSSPDEDYTALLIGDEDAVDSSGDILANSLSISEISSLGYTNGTHYEEGFISMRGTQFSSGADDQYKFKVPGELLKTTWTFSTVEAATSEPDTSTFTLHEGDETAVGTSGVKIKVVSIDQQLTPCTMSAGAGEAPACTPDMSTVSAVIMPDNAPSVQTIVPYSLTSNLVYLDTDNVALGTGVIITVGGDSVNTVTKDAVEGSDVDFEATPVVVKQLGNKIVVAGLSAEDTMAAAEQFLAELTN